MDCFRLSATTDAQLPSTVTDELRQGNYFVRTENTLLHKDNLSRVGIAATPIRNAKGQDVCPDRPYRKGLLGSNLGGTCTESDRFGFVCRETGLGSSDRKGRQDRFVDELQGLLTAALQVPASAVVAPASKEDATGASPSAGEQSGEQSGEKAEERAPESVEAAHPTDAASLAPAEDRCMLMLQDINAMCGAYDAVACDGRMVCEYSEVNDRCQLHHDLFHACDVPILGGKLM